MHELPELTSLAKQINTKSDRINTVLATYNSKLSKLNLGTEVWLDKALPTEERRTDKAGVCYREAGYLGYSRRTGEWELSVREVNEDIQPDGTTIQAAPVRYHSLIKCRRDLRVAALEQLPQLLDMLKAEGERLLKLINAGEKTAQAF